jgi:hypothetical protein
MEPAQLHFDFNSVFVVIKFTAVKKVVGNANLKFCAERNYSMTRESTR